MFDFIITLCWIIIVFLVMALADLEIQSLREELKQCRAIHTPQYSIP